MAASPKTSPAFENYWTNLNLAPFAHNIDPSKTLSPRTSAPIDPTETEDERTEIDTGNFLVTEQIAALPLWNVREATETINAELPPDAPALEVIRTIGEGGMGTVALVTQPSLKREIALKRINPQRNTLRNLRRLLEEGRTTGSLEHPNIIPIHALGRDHQGHPLLLMKHVEGVSWDTLIHQPEHPFWAKRAASSQDPLQRNLELLLEVCQAIEFAHSRGIIHRDIKPDNVMLGEFGELYILDWGIAVQCDPDTPIKHLPTPIQPPRGLVGSPAYMAPEMLHGSDKLITPRTDIFLLGATLHEILTGFPRHAGNTLLEVLCSAFHSSPYPYPSSLPADLVAICERATAHQPKDRYPSAAAMRHDLAAYLHHRVSIRLTHEASERLQRLQNISPTTDIHTTQLQPYAVHSLFTECRFGYFQALQEWPENTEAKEGLQQCFKLMFRYELQLDNLEAAQALLQEIYPPDPSLYEALQDKRKSAEQQKSEQARLKHLEQQLDSSFSDRERSMQVVTLGIFIALFGFIVTALQTKRILEPNNITGLLFASLSLLIIHGYAFLGPKILLHHTISRRSLMLQTAVSIFIFFNHLLCMLQNLSISHAIVNDMLLGGLIAASVGFTVRRWSWYLVPMFLGGALLCIWKPQHAFLIIGACGAFMVFVYTMLGLRVPITESPDPPPKP